MIYNVLDVRGIKIDSLQSASDTVLVFSSVQ